MVSAGSRPHGQDGHDGHDDRAAAAPATAPEVAQVWAWLAQVEDPEIPVISIVDLGIVRDVQRREDAQGLDWEVTLTPTYSGCPATHVIAQAVTDSLRHHGIERLRVTQRLSPAWTTDWLSEDGKRRLREYGIAPPVGRPAVQAIDVARIGRGRPAVPAPQPLEEQPAGLQCPRCDSPDVELISRFGSTPCKALYRCRACREPFDHFKCH